MTAAGIPDADLTGGTGNEIGIAFAAFAIARVVRTNVISLLNRVAVKFDKAFVKTLLGGINGIVVAGVKTDIRITITDA